MLFLRMGPRFLFIRTEEIEKMKDFLEAQLNGVEIDFHPGMERASEDSTLCFLTGTNFEKTCIEDAKVIVLINDVASAILTAIINSHVSQLLHRVDMGPSSIVMRVASNGQKIIDRLIRDFNGEAVSWIDGIRKGEKDDTIITFTSKAINGPLAEKDFFERKLLIPQPSRVVQKRLRVEGLQYITQSLNDSQWYELRINIYDSMGKYQENYDRLIYILSKLELGMILGESWTKDHALMLYSVLAYQIRLFTFYTPQEIKELLLALEYNLEGKRLVDFDLYYRNKKISWRDINKSKGRKDKLQEAANYRKSLYLRLEEADIKTLEEMEKPL
ncbi:hypothetical protein [Alkaliphilus serpentinus]|uniref:Uncharacterized protein n=1 Tax=Alkaliphilus serpentinus TaxID=1482731 RepID=A0A833MB78_9FIRM|nr:hypothetical protein [Alkaliphilus serpentinus]KAB3532512.1 hypothetical protein F8153_02425 [Alkaliphilus serpentinus]